MIEIGKVISSKPGNIIVLLDSIEVFERNKDRLRISRYVSIEDGNNANILASIRDIAAVQSPNADTINYTVTCSPIGYYFDFDGVINFRQGGVNLPSPTEPAYLPDDVVINSIFSSNQNFSFLVGKLANNYSIKYYFDRNKFFGKHIAFL